MDYQTAENILASIDSYKNAYARMLKRCPSVRFNSSGNPILGVVSGQIEPGWTGKVNPSDLDTFQVYRREELFEYGRPKLIQRGWHIWTGGWLWVTGSVIETWTAFGTSYKILNEDGSTRSEESSQSEKHTLTLTVNLGGFGLGAFIDTPDKVRTAFPGLRPEHQVIYATEAERAFTEVAKWKAALAETIKAVS